MLESAYTIAFAKIFGSFNTETVRSCQFYCGSLPIYLRINARKFKFISALSSVNNSLLKAIFNRVDHREILKIKIKYNLNEHCNSNTIYPAPWNYFVNLFSDVIEVH